jgi:hypothetical protein
MDAIIGGTEIPAMVIYPMPFIEATAADYKADKPADYPGLTTIPDALVTQMLAAQ